MTQSSSARLILASASPRRADLLARLGVPFDIQPVDIDEQFGRSSNTQIVARRLAAAKGTVLPDPDLASLDEGTAEFTHYIKELRWAQRFALLNREEMMDRVITQFGRWVGGPVREKERINCHHNFTQMENHFGRNVWITRKGAIEAREGMKAVIPGSMRVSASASRSASSGPRSRRAR